MHVTAGWLPPLTSRSPFIPDTPPPCVPLREALGAGRLTGRGPGLSGVPSWGVAMHPPWGHREAGVLHLRLMAPVPSCSRGQLRATGSLCPQCYLTLTGACLDSWSPQGTPTLVWPGKQAARQ